jgi:hypothetical protein
MHAPRAVLVVWLVLAGTSAAQMQLTMTDGTTTRGSFGGIAANGKWTWAGVGGEMKLAADQIVSLETPEGTPPALEDAFRIELVGGDSLIARIEDGSADDVRVRAPAFGDVTIPLDEIATIWNLDFPRAAESLPRMTGREEALYKDADGRTDKIEGVLERIGKNQVVFSSDVFSSDAGNKRTFSFNKDRIVAIKLTPVGPKRPEPKGAASIIRLKDGSRLSGTLGPSDAGTFSVKLSIGLSMTVDARWVKSVALTNASLRYVSDLEPSSFVETPLSDGVLPQGLRRDQGLKSGQPLRIGRRTFSKGLLLPARSRITWPLDGKFSRLLAMVGIDGGVESGELGGSAKATIFVDGQVRWTSEVLKGGQAPESIDVNGLAGGRELAIEVDFADSFDGGARIVFGNAMLIR